MNLLNQFEQLFNRQEKAVSRVSGQLGSGRVVATTLTGATVILIGETETGQLVYYDRASGQILSVAPDVDFAEYGV